MNPRRRVRNGVARQWIATALLSSCLVAGASIALDPSPAFAAPIAGKITITFSKSSPSGKNNPTVMSRFNQLKSSGSAQNRDARAASDVCASRYGSCSNDYFTLKQYKKTTDTVPFGTISYQLVTGQQSQQNSNRVAVSALWGVIGSTGSPVPGTLTLTFNRADGPDYDTIGTMTSPLNTDGTQAYSDGFEWFPNVQTDPVYNSYSNVQYVPTAQVPGIPQDYPTGGGLTDLRVRCDRIPQFRNTGCVNPSNYPTLTTMVYEPHVADNIRAGQAAGQPGAPGGTPLIRTTTAQGDINRGLACSAARTAALPPPPSDMVRPTCDEYPFASSEQGGATATIAWVPKAENDNQGTSIGDFQRAYRVVPTDRFYVQV